MCLRKTLEKLELAVGMTIPDGFDPNIKVHRLGLDPVVVRALDHIGDGD